MTPYLACARYPQVLFSMSLSLERFERGGSRSSFCCAMTLAGICLHGSYETLGRPLALIATADVVVVVVLVAVLLNTGVATRGQQGGRQRRDDPRVTASGHRPA